MRMIDADALIEKFNEKVNMAECLVDERTAERFATFCALADVVEEMPTVDAVPVIRCKDCTFGRYIDHGHMHCLHPCGLTTNMTDDFCSYAEQKIDWTEEEETHDSMDKTPEEW